ncbi:hypothetical protein F750_1560 [Streptomyces sp. PAMC 26508]|nr:hypothetical protein F750_1560 [Streptomyces sp. PAMC 26508]
MTLGRASVHEAAITQAWHALTEFTTSSWPERPRPHHGSGTGTLSPCL